MGEDESIKELVSTYIIIYVYLMLLSRHRLVHLFRSFQIGRQ